MVSSSSSGGNYSDSAGREAADAPVTGVVQECKEYFGLEVAGNSYRLPPEDEEDNNNNNNSGSSSYRNKQNNSNNSLSSKIGDEKGTPTPRSEDTAYRTTGAGTPCTHEIFAPTGYNISTWEAPIQNTSNTTS